MKISIIVPVYNVEKYINRCLDSIVNQTYSNIEIILVNDGSTDQSREICIEYLNSDPRVVLIDKVNGGLSDARNTGISRASGEYILFVDSDDYINIDTCEKFVKALNGKDADVVVSDFIIEYDNDKGVNVTHRHLENEVVYDSDEYLIKTIKSKELRMEAWQMMYNLEFWRKYNLNFKKNIYHEDMQLTPIILLYAKRILYVKNSFYHYVQRCGSIMHQNNIEKRICDTLDIYKEWLELANEIQSKECKKYFLGFTVQCYRRSCISLGMSKNILMSDWKIVMCSVGVFEKIKSLLFIIMPTLYRRLVK